jgi:hypothetical protein
MAVDQSSGLRTFPIPRQFGLALSAEREAERLFLVILDALAGFPVDK